MDAVRNPQAAPARERITADEFRLMDHLPPTAQLLDGEIILTPSPIYDHQESNGLFFAWLRLFVVPKIGGLVVAAPMDVNLDEYNVVQPDVFYCAPNSRCTIGPDRRFYGAPELTIELLSPSTARHDRKTKFELYERAGVLEYWIADLAYRSIEVFLLKNGRFERFGWFGREDTFHSPTLGGELVTVAVLIPENTLGQ